PAAPHRPGAREESGGSSPDHDEARPPPSHERAAKHLAGPQPPGGHPGAGEEDLSAEEKMSAEAIRLARARLWPGPNLVCRLLLEKKKEKRHGEPRQEEENEAQNNGKADSMIGLFFGRRAVSTMTVCRSRQS